MPLVRIDKNSSEQNLTMFVHIARLQRLPARVPDVDATDRLARRAAATKFSQLRWVSASESPRMDA
jgi:hypothetical protein